MPSSTLVVADYPIGYQSGFGETLYNLFSGFPDDKLWTAHPSHLSPSDEKKRGASIKLSSPRRPKLIPSRWSLIYYPFLKAHQYIAARQAVRMLAAVVSSRGVKNLVVVPVTPWILSAAIALHRSFPSLNLVLFVMDDWQGHHQCHRLPYSRRRQRLLAEAIGRANARFAISKEMAEHYEQIYGNRWQVVHNGVENHSPVSPVHAHNSHRVLLAGDVNVFRFDAVIAFANAIERYNECHQRGIEFTILGDIADEYLPSLSALRCTKLMGRQSHSQCLVSMRDSDLLYLPLAFAKQSNRISRYSLPTKLPEYLASGTTILFHAPVDSATFRLAERHNLTPRLGSTAAAELDQFIHGWITGTQNGREAQERARRALIEEFDIKVLATRFQSALV